MGFKLIHFQICFDSEWSGFCFLKTINRAQYYRWSSENRAKKISSKHQWKTWDQPPPPTIIRRRNQSPPRLLWSLHFRTLPSVQLNRGNAEDQTLWWLLLHRLRSPAVDFRLLRSCSQMKRRFLLGISSKALIWVNLYEVNFCTLHMSNYFCICLFVLQLALLYFYY